MPFNKIAQQTPNGTNPIGSTLKILHVPDEHPHIWLYGISAAKRLCTTLKPFIVLDSVTNMRKPNRRKYMISARIQQHTVAMCIPVT